MIPSTQAAIYEQHASDVGFLWLLRDVAARDPAYDLAALCDLDARVDAHLDGLALAGDPGWEICKASLGKDEESGDAFAAAFLAVGRRDLRGVAHVLDVGGTTPELARGIVAGLAWASPDHFAAILPGFLDDRCPPALHYLGIAGSAAHRRDPGAMLGYATVSADARVRARALRAVGELGRLDLISQLRTALRDEDPACRFWASWSAALLGESEAAQVLFRFAGQEGPFAARACCTAMRRMDPAIAYGWLHSLSSGPTAKAALEGAAALGDPAIMPWILECMRTPDLARLAGAAFTRITGADLVAEKLRTRPPEGFQAGPTEDPADEDVSLDPEESLPFPDPAAVTAYWGRKNKDFKRGTRYLLGKPITSTEWLERVLREGSQPARAAAAEELTIKKPRRPLFETRARGPRQRAELS